MTHLERDGITDEHRINIALIASQLGNLRSRLAIKVMATLTQAITKTINPGASTHLTDQKPGFDGSSNES